jgi:hypothetical protein
LGERSSGRLRAQPNADATQLERAMLLAQRHDDPLAQGMCSPLKSSFLAFSDESILEKSGVVRCVFWCFSCRTCCVGHFVER